MKCGFCGREIDMSVLECPYCHYQIQKEAQVLTPDERDTFEGITIEEDGSTDQEVYGGNRQERVPPNFKVRTFSFGNGILSTLLIIGVILAFCFFLLPAFLIFALIGAVIVFFLRLFA